MNPQIDYQQSIINDISNIYYLIDKFVKQKTKQFCDKYSTFKKRDNELIYQEALHLDYHMYKVRRWHQIKQKVFYFIQNKNFLNKANLRYRVEIETLTPTIKINYHQIAQLCGGIETQVLQQTQKVNDKSIVSTKQTGVDRSLYLSNNGRSILNFNLKNKTKKQIEVDSGYFGKILRFDSTFTFEPFLKSKKFNHKLKRVHKQKRLIINKRTNENFLNDQELNLIIIGKIEQSQLMQSKKAAFEIFSENSQQKMMQTPTTRIGKLEHIPIMPEQLKTKTFLNQQRILQLQQFNNLQNYRMQRYIFHQNWINLLDFWQLQFQE
ncbi:unnamed protein product [Paramecium sonneborni]|uniref:Uncharacterized protein n=1 Tax=Paramecium sonneborni TaxID=65129 RepID=A0A8S1RTT2_9CILI|nr:unnamed protein product [Paramecium sonneborni]